MQNLIEKNPNLKIYSVNDPEFLTFGKVVDSIDVSSLIEEAKKIALPETGSSYQASTPAFEALPVAKQIADYFYGSMPTEIGYCWGHSNFLNAGGQPGLFHALEKKFHGSAAGASVNNMDVPGQIVKLRVCIASGRGSVKIHQLLLRDPGFAAQGDTMLPERLSRFRIFRKSPHCIPGFDPAAGEIC